MFANCQVDGIDNAMFDICLTPPVPVPIPYTNVGLGCTAIANVSHILFAAMPAHNLCTIIPVTQGDSPGVMGGVVSGTVMGSSQHTSGVASFLVGGAPATRLTSPTQQNLTNAIGMRVCPSQNIIMLLGG